jgi:hypothetical protein
MVRLAEADWVALTLRALPGHFELGGGYGVLIVENLS